MGGRRDIFGCYGTSFEANKWRSLDPCGLLGLSMSVSVHLFAFVVIARYLIEGSLVANGIFLLLYTPTVILALASLYMAWSTDPGTVPMGARPLVTVRRSSSRALRRRAIRRCHKCNDNFKPSRAHHDSVTGRCIVKFDHFCPWVGNAVGALNHKFFTLFVFYTMWTCLLSLGLIILRAVHCIHESKGDTLASTILNETSVGGGSRLLAEGDAAKDECIPWNDNLNVLVLLIISVVFLGFTCVMLCDTVDAIRTNSSKIARMKMRVGTAGTELSRVTEEFNEMFGGESNAVAWHWFIPVSPQFPRGMKKVVLGYEWDETFENQPYEEQNDEEEGRIEMTAFSANLQ